MYTQPLSNISNNTKKIVSLLIIKRNKTNKSYDEKAHPEHHTIKTNYQYIIQKFLSHLIVSPYLKIQVHSIFDYSDKAEINALTLGL